MARYIIDCDPELFDVALTRLLGATVELKNCSVGYGYAYGGFGDQPRFFARRTKLGFSITQTQPERNGERG